MIYSISKEKGGQWYCHPVDSKEPVPGSFGDKKKAVKVAARLNGMTVKEFLKERKKNDKENN
jgi:hypothetical protein